MGNGAIVTRTVVLDVVGLTREFLDSRMPYLQEWAAKRSVSTITPVLPAVTCTAQATFYTGEAPAQHGIVANGWYFRDDCEIHFWRQSNRLIQAPKFWDLARQHDPQFTFANLFGWFNMYSSADISITPRPMYPADGRKIPDVYTEPPALRTEIQQELGAFPLFDFWGPRASIASTRWIAASAKYVEERFHPALTFVYLPHLDYNLQRLGPEAAAIGTDLAAVDRILGELIDFYEARDTRVIVLSEYGIVPVNKPVHLNRLLREAGLLRVREELDLELLDPGASAAFAVADHQLAHVYVNDPSKRDMVRRLLEQTDGVDAVLDESGKRELGIDHSRAGEFVVVAKPEAWFTYYYWLDDRKAPDFARTVDIHRKPGYDPVELFVDPAIRLPMVRIASKLVVRKLGFRNLFDIIPLDASLVKGSHGRTDNSALRSPIFIGNGSSETIAAIQVSAEILSSLGMEI
jgi:predicted AlkP superfamily pyrophosphatase or phosphodiesterase